MAEATGPPLPLGNHPNRVDITHPNYAIDSNIWQETPKQFNEHHMNTASMTAKTTNASKGADPRLQRVYQNFF